jgi:DNA repair protein SbcD/Mre11
VITFIHTADIHLDSPFKGIKQLDPQLFEEIYQSTFASFHELISRAIAAAVDFFLISGDIYDEENQSVKAQAFLREELGRLDQAGIPVFLSHGNHDFLGREALKLQLPDNVTIFEKEVATAYLTTKQGEKVAITGFSYPSRWVEERMILEYPQRDMTADYHIGMLHGYLEGLHSSEGVYAPFSLGELNMKNYDYWALGHIHKRQTLQLAPPVVYCGNTQGRNPNETEEKGAYLVTLQRKMEPLLQFMPTAPIVWEKAEVSLAGCVSLNDVFERIDDILAHYQTRRASILLSVVFRDTQDLHPDVIAKMEDGDLLDGVPQQFGKPFCYLYSLKIAVDTEKELFPFDQVMKDSFSKSWTETAADDVFYQRLDQFFQHAVIRTKFAELRKDETFKAEVLEAAKTRLVQAIAFEEDSVEDSED